MLYLMGRKMLKLTSVYLHQIGIFPSLKLPLKILSINKSSSHNQFTANFTFIGPHKKNTKQTTLDFQSIADFLPTSFFTAFPENHAEKRRSLWRVFYVLALKSCSLSRAAAAQSLLFSFHEFIDPFI
jgi:hypothetical protein